MEPVSRARERLPPFCAAGVDKMSLEDPPHLADDFRAVQAEVVGGDQLLRDGPRDASALIAHQAVRPIPGR
jgi:hypothetical protein